MTITTKKGDKGMTDYFGKRVAKDSDVIELLGNLDELQAVMLIIDYELRITNLKQVTEDLGEIMGQKPMGKKIKNLEKEIDKLWMELKPMSQFVIFKKEKAIKINWARTVARRAERQAVACQNYELRITNYENMVIYLNRLSDYLYLLALKEERK